MKPANLDFLFNELITNFAHLLTSKRISKKEFANIVKTTYSIENPKTALFYQSILRSEFETIKLSADRNSILFNH